MPHSSGGGSHSGGSHSGGGHSGGGSHSGGSRGPRISNRPFVGSRRFMYFDRHGMEHYIYSQNEPMPQSIGSLIMSMLFFVPFVIIGLVVFLAAIGSMLPTKPLTPSYVENGIHIEDRANLISNERELEETLNKFEDLTGICPYVITVNDSAWWDNYDSLENYAYSLYVNSFYDEQHFLIVYSEPDNAAELEFVDWRWEGMQGDDTDAIITVENFNMLSNDLQKYFTIDSVSVGDALNKAFSSSLDYMMSGSFDLTAGFGYIFFTLIWNGITYFAIFGIIKGYVTSKRAYREVPMDYQSGSAQFTDTPESTFTNTSTDKDSWDL